MRRFLISGVFFCTANTAIAACPPLLDREMHTIHEKPQSLCEYAGKVVLVVNTASECGFTPQYEGLEALYRKYRERGFVVLGFPSNDFGGWNFHKYLIDRSGTRVQSFDTRVDPSNPKLVKEIEALLAAPAR